MNLAKTVVAAAASFRVAETKEDCEFPTPTENMDLFYFYSIIVVAPSLLWFLFVCAICVPFALICRQPKNHLLEVNRKNKILDTKNFKFFKTSDLYRSSHSRQSTFSSIFGCPSVQVFRVIGGNLPAKTLLGLWRVLYVESEHFQTFANCSISIRFQIFQNNWPP